ncbi:ribonuclease H family protein [Vibrio coralliirubri]|uniref:ribonuclease H family protein n=1 Tax=Vibrio coralliirubri TaxID=1516159 RepID=UPI002284F99E|nr:ribonuclease H family protein [Vibrio coralliirubri]MCY9861130.1 ribonuclease H family protein [Vibrio coralliirubri]
MSKKNHYVVWVGRTTGVFDNWADTQAQISGFSGALFKGFTTLDEATAAFDAGYANAISTPSKLSTASKVKGKPASLVGIPTHECITVDGAFSGSSKKMEYQCVMNLSREIIFRSKPFVGGSNNIAEFLALIGAIRYRESIKRPDLDIYSDSKTALAWVRDKQLNTTIDINTLDPVIQGRISSALQYIQTNPQPQNLKKWDTASWGEIPADFGRK